MKKENEIRKRIKKKKKLMHRTCSLPIVRGL
jgi:hypothetical protein